MKTFFTSAKPLAGLLLACGSSLFAQETFSPGEQEKIVRSEAERHAKNQKAHLMRQAQGSGAPNDYDISYHKTLWKLDPAKRFIAGSVQTFFYPKTAAFKTLSFDLHNDLKVDSVKYAGKPAVFSHQNNVLKIELGGVLPAGSKGDAIVYYQGVPPSADWDAFFTQTNNSGAPALWTLSEPYGAPSWWPCNSTLLDKIDSIDVVVQAPNPNKVASNGLLMSVKDLGNGWSEHHWKHRYPIAAYLVAVAVSNYVEYSNFATVGGKQMEILNYVYPNSLATAKQSTKSCVDMVETFSKKFGDYPFANEKYGHAEFGWGGGMEHQTMSFMANFSFSLMAHELAHQWFGDKITCGSWQHIWLNEGFATYLTGLMYEKQGKASWDSWKLSTANGARLSTTSVFVEDTTSVSRIFSNRSTYSKGGYLVHMLRGQMGDAAFYKGVNDYINDPKLRYNHAFTVDLQKHLEAASGMKLEEITIKML